MTTAHDAAGTTRRLRSLAARLGAVVCLFAFGGTLLSACGPGAESRPPMARPAEDSFQGFDGYEVHYNALRTDELGAEIARAYGIERSANRVLLNVSLLQKAPDGRTTPVDGEVSASAYNLNGQVKGLEMRRVQEGDSIYFIGEVGISGNEILVFDIASSPRGGHGPYMVKFKREFFAD